jgi:hypothetical protein
LQDEQNCKTSREDGDRPMFGDDAHFSPLARLFWRPSCPDAPERARAVRSSPATAPGKSVSLGEVFTFLSGLYFRGKLAYANAFARPDLSRVLVITPTRGLFAAATPVTLRDLREFAEVDIAETDPRYRRPLERDLRRLVKQLTPALRSRAARKRRDR